MNNFILYIKDGTKIKYESDEHFLDKVLEEAMNCDWVSGFIIGDESKEGCFLGSAVVGVENEN